MALTSMGEDMAAIVKGFDKAENAIDRAILCDQLMNNKLSRRI